MFTPIYQALGIGPGDLSLRLIEQAVEHGVRETGALDWKTNVYDPRKPQWDDEAAKDIAAMANSGGGWIVFGVAEDSETSAAMDISPIQWNADMQQRIIRVAYVRIGPRKGDVVFIAPRRTRPHTVFMNDREIERGFRERFQQADNREQRLQVLFEHASKGLNPEDGVCLVGAAAPVEPSGSLEPPREEDVYRLVNQASFLTCSRKNTTPSNVSGASEVLVMLASTARMRRGDQCD